MKGFALYDSETQKVLAHVLVTTEIDDNVGEDVGVAWYDFNVLGENPTDVNSFITWFNESYENQIEILDMDFVKHEK